VMHLPGGEVNEIGDGFRPVEILLTVLHCYVAHQIEKLLIKFFVLFFKRSGMQ